VAIGRVEYQRAGLVGKPVRLAPRPVSLAGREGLLAEVDARLSGREGSGLWTVALCGLAGAGKTSVALAYAHRHVAEVGVAWQLACENPTVLAAGFGELAVQLGARDILDPGDPAASVHRVLAAFPAEWLLVFDNAPDQVSVESFLPPAGRGRVLITSQNQTWPPGQALDVPVLSTDVSAQFLVARTSDPDEQAAVELAGEVGGLPLALEQAAAYVQATGGTLAGYLRWFRRRRLDILARGEPTGYSKTVATTWSLAFGQLEESAPSAADLLRLLACCAPEVIPLRLLLQPRPGIGERLGPLVAPALLRLLEDPLAAADAVAVLRRYSLITPAGDGLVLVHRLVQAITLDQMPAGLAGAWRQAAAAVIEAAIPADPQPPSAWPACGALLPNARVALASGSAGMRLIADYLGHSGSYAAARDVYQDVVEARVGAFGPEGPETLAARASLAHRTGKAGDAAGARDQYAALLPVYQRVSGPEHRETLAIARADLARFTGEAGDAAGARDQYAALLPVAEHVFGPDHPEVLSDRGNLARFTGEAGDAAGARDQFAALLPVSERMLGPEHPNTLITRACLARFTAEAGDAAAARDQFAALLPAMERVLGSKHPYTLAAQNDLAE
jgi:hypothetical protein